MIMSIISNDENVKVVIEGKGWGVVNVFSLVLGSILTRPPNPVYYLEPD